MNELVFLQNQQALTTSLKVAEYFDKRHDRVLRAIEDAQSNLPKIGDVKKAFNESTYVDAKGETRPMYLLNRDGFMFVVMGFTGKKAAELKWNYIQAFNAMEAALAERQSERWQADNYYKRHGIKYFCKEYGRIITDIFCDLLNICIKQNLKHALIEKTAIHYQSERVDTKKYYRQGNDEPSKNSWQGLKNCNRQKNFKEKIACKDSK